MGLAGLAGLAFFLIKRRGQREDPNAVPPLAPDPVMTMAGYEQLKLYNPADPTTFPKRVTDGDPSYSTERTVNAFQPGRYGGAPEI